jgi:hypothetical protein
MIFRTAERQDRLVGVRGNHRRRWLALLCWLLFAAGLLVQLISPRLKVSNRAFVIPPQMAAGKTTIRLEEIVGGQRRTQVLSALLTLGGAVGLAFLYRETLVRAASRRGRQPVGELTYGDSTRSQHPRMTQKTLDEETIQKNQHELTTKKQPKPTIHNESY